MLLKKKQEISCISRRSEPAEFFRVRKFFSVIYACCYVIINVAARFCLIEQKMEELRRWKNILAMKRCRKNSKS